ncbi:MAG: Smr/MutS family protein [Metamycoplasmataceae bacterium]
MELDLHGYNVEDATSAIMMIFISFKESEYETELIVITGKGTQAMKITFLNLIDQEDELYYEEINGGGSFIVKKYQY